MSSSLKNILDLIKRSLWFIPFCMTILGLGLGISVNYLDSYFWSAKVPYLGEAWGISFEGIQSLFTSVSAAIITAMTTILSITLLIFTVLAGNYGSHVLRVFKVRTFSKFVIGWFSSVYTFIIYSIYSISIANEKGYVPQLSLTLGVIFTLSTIFLLIVYVHFLVRQIQVGTLISEASLELCNSIKSLDAWTPSDEGDNEIYLTEEGLNMGQRFTLDSSGYIQSIDKKKLQQIALNNNWVIKIIHRQGEFIVTEEPAFIIYTENKIENELISTIKSCWLLGEKRIPVEDLEYTLDIVTEMTLKALSPGINDIFLANTCIDYLGESFALLVRRRFPKNHVHHSDGKLLLITKEFSFEGYMNSALNMIRQYASDHCSAAIRIMDVLIKVAQLNASNTYQEVINCHFMAIYNSAAKKHIHPLDQASINYRHQIFLTATGAAQ